MLSVLFKLCEWKVEFKVAEQEPLELVSVDRLKNREKFWGLNWCDGIIINALAFENDSILHVEAFSCVYSKEEKW